MKIIKTLVPLLLLFSTSSNAILTLEYYSKYKHSTDPAVKNTLFNYLSGVNGTMLVMNETFFVRTNIHLYCQPKNLALNTTQLFSIIDEFLEYKPQHDKKTPIEFVAIEALEYTFPCN